jgi:hypothetical protein
MSDSSLKRLQFVQQAAASASGLAETAYKTARSYTPKFVEPLVSKVEDTAATVGAPYVTFLADTGAKVLHNADELVRERAPGPDRARRARARRADA